MNTTHPAAVTPHTPTSPSAAAADTASNKELVLKVMPMPSDCNINGDVFGGWVMSQVDIAGSVLPFRLTGGRLATVAVKEFIFRRPVHVGDLLSFYATITRVGNTSVTVSVEVFAERMLEPGKVELVTQAVLTYVAIDDQGRPRPVRPASDNTHPSA